jgi:hypothetical protein
MKKLIAVLFAAFMLLSVSSNAQIDLPKIDLKNFSIDQLLGKVLQVKRGWAPQFFSGKSKIPKINIVRDLLNTKNNSEINKLFGTFKTGRLVYRITNYAGAAVALYGTIKKISQNADSLKKGATAALVSGLTSMSVGTIVKLLTKAASYKAVDMFGGVIKKKLLDIISFDAGPSANYIGRTSFKAALVIHL